MSATAASGVTVEYLDASDLTLADADGNTTGFQVDLAVGENAFKVTSGADTETYTVTVERDSAQFAGWTPSRDVHAPVAGTAVDPDDWELIPSGLGGGDKFRLLFLSSTSRNAASNKIADYNTFIQNRATAGHPDIATYSAGFRVVGCTAAVDARDNTGTNKNTDGAGVPIYWVDGSRVADDNADFYDGAWADEANDKNESGTDGPDTSIGAGFPWTGCKHNGTESFDGADSRALGKSRVRVGKPNDTVDSGAGPISSNGLAGNPNTKPMYGLSQVFEVAAPLPEVSAGLVLTGTPVIVDENGSDTFTVALATQPTVDVTVDVSSTDTAAATVSPAQLTFTAANWDTAQTVTVTGVGDDDSANETLTVTLDADSTDAGYIALGDVTVKVTVVDDGKVPDDWGLIPSGLGDGDKFRLLFLSSTSTDATSTDIADYNTFIQNHAEAGRMELDAYIGGFRAVGCTADVDARDNTGTNTDTDGAGVPIYWLDGSRVADDNTDFYDGDWADETNIKNESGTDHPITSQVSYPFTGCDHNGTEKFDGANSRALGAAPVALGQPNTAATNDGPLSSVTNSANDTQRAMYGLSQVFEVAAPLPEVNAGLVLTGTPVQVNEDGSDTFTVALATEPTAEVTVDVTSNDTAAATVSTARLTFATSNWDTAQAVTVTGVDDADTADETLTITLDADSISGSDYNTLANVTVNVTVNDDDSAGLVLTGTPVQVNEDGSDTFTVALATEPTAEVTVDVTSNDTAAATVSTARLTFATSNWDTAQAVTVTGVDDADTADETLTITLDADSISGSDYNTLANVTVNVTVNDDDSAGLVLTGTPVQVNENGSDTCSPSLWPPEPTAEVTVDVTSQRHRRGDSVNGPVDVRHQQLGHRPAK